MTVSNQIPISGPYAADGLNRDWPFDFRVDDPSHIRVEVTALDATIVTYDSGFTIDGILGSDSGGTVVFPIAPESPVISGYSVRIYRMVPYSQPMAIGNQGAFYPVVHEDALDHLAMQIQQLAAGGPGSGLQDAVEAAAESAAIAEAAAASVAGTVGQAEAAVGAAEDQADAAAASAALAAAWAESPSEVVPGGRSAKWWAEQAEAAVTGGDIFATGVISTPFAGVVATTVQAALQEIHGDIPDVALFAPKASPALTGVPTAPTAAPGTNTDQLATTAFVQADVDSGVIVAAGYTNTQVAAETAARTTALAGKVSTTGAESIAGVKTFSDKPKVPAEVYGGGWAASLEVPTKGDVYTKIQSMASGIVPYGLLYGCTLSRNGSDSSNDVDFAAGAAMDSTNTEMIVIPSTLTKRIDGAWAVGSGQGGMDTGVVANNTWYYAHAIKRTDTGVVDGLLSLSRTAPTLPAGYTKWRYLGGIRRETSANRSFIQRGDDFYWDSGNVSDYNSTPSSSGSLITLRVPPNTIAMFNAVVEPEEDPTSTNTYGIILLETPLIVANAVSLTRASLIGDTDSGENGYPDAGMFFIQTDSSSRIRARSHSSQSPLLHIETFGWRDQRGRVFPVA